MLSFCVSSTQLWRIITQKLEELSKCCQLKKYRRKHAQYNKKIRQNWIIFDFMTRSQSLPIFHLQWFQISFRLKKLVFLAQYYVKIVLEKISSFRLWSVWTSLIILQFLSFPLVKTLHSPEWNEHPEFFLHWWDLISFFVGQWYGCLTKNHHAYSKTLL